MRKNEELESQIVGSAASSPEKQLTTTTTDDDSMQGGVFSREELLSLLEAERRKTIKLAREVDNLKHPGRIQSLGGNQEAQRDDYLPQIELASAGVVSFRNSKTSSVITASMEDQPPPEFWGRQRQKSNY